VLFEFDKRGADLDYIALDSEQPRNAAAPRRGHLNDRFIGLDRHEGLIGNYANAFGHVPGDDFRVLKPFP
jgi:hypothetical protein